MPAEMNARTEPFTLTDAELDDTVRLGRESVTAVTVFDAEEAWLQLSPDDQAEIGVAAIVAIYARYLRGSACSKHDRLYETLEFQTYEMLFERVADLVFPRKGLPVWRDVGCLYDEYLNDLMPNSTKGDPQC